MANRRMFSREVIDSDLFLDMPLTAQALYFHLGMRADDDGFINNPKRIQKMLGGCDDDYKLLLAKGFLIYFESGVYVITHWHQNNYIQKDRYKETQYKKEKKMLMLGENNTYLLMDTDCIQTGYRLDTQVRLEVGKDRLGKREGINVNNSPHPSVDEIKNFCDEQGIKIDYEKFVNHFNSVGWQINGSPLIDWKSRVMNWYIEDKEREPKKLSNSTKVPKGIFNNYNQRIYSQEEIDEILKRKQSQ